MSDVGNARKRATHPAPDPRLHASESQPRKRHRTPQPAANAQPSNSASDDTICISDDDDDEVQFVAMIRRANQEEDQEEGEVVESVGSGSCDHQVIDLSHCPSETYYVVIRGLVNGNSWSGVVHCAECALKAVQGAPPGASSYFFTKKRLDRAYRIVHGEVLPAQTTIHGPRSVWPRLCDVVMYTDGASLDGDSKMVKEVWAEVSTDKNVFAGYGVWFGQDSPFNSCGPVTLGQGSHRAEMYAVCVGLETVLEKMPWAGRLLIRTDAKLQDLRDDSKRAILNNYQGCEDVDLLKRFATSIAQLEEKKVIVLFEWVKGHALSYGNCCADRLARAGALAKLSPTQSFVAERHIKWHPYVPREYEIPLKKRGPEKEFANIPNSEWKDRKYVIDAWIARQEQAGNTYFPCLQAKVKDQDVNGWQVLDV